MQFHKPHGSSWTQGPACSKRSINTAWIAIVAFRPVSGLSHTDTVRHSGCQLGTTAENSRAGLTI